MSAMKGGEASRKTPAGTQRRPIVEQPRRRNVTIQANKQVEFPLYPAGIHLARLKAVGLFTAKPNMYHPEPYPKLRWEWQMKVPGTKEPVPYSTFTTLSLHPNSYLPGLLKAIGVTPTEEGSFEENACIGKIAYLVVEEVMGKEGKPINQTKNYAPYVRGEAAPTIEAPAPVPTPAPTSSGGVIVAEKPAPAAIADDNPFADDDEPF
jgi:hypothetical protein